MTRWNYFGSGMTIPVVSWTAAALIAAAFRSYPFAYFMGSMALVALLAQYQWGRA